jgi:mycothiol synthase
MALDISPCVTDDDLEAWRRVRIAVIPYERTQSIAEIRADETPERLLVVAREDGVVVGSGMATRSEIGKAGTVIPRVLPEHRRRGHGTALLERLVDHVAGLGHRTVRAGADDDGSLAFAHRFGFEEVNREVEQTYRLAGPVEPPPAPEGIEFVTEQEHPGLWDAAYERFGLEALADFAVDAPLEVSREGWTRSWLGDPMFLALHDGEVVGCAGLGLDPDQPTRAENGLTAVRRDWRGRGLAVHLKLVTLAWAAEHGIEEVYTWTQDGNAAMRALNERLGYDTTMVGIQLARPLAGLLGHA